MVRTSLMVLLVAAIAFLAGACAPFYGPLPPPPPPPEEGEIRLGLGYLQKKQTIEARGRIEDGTFRARILKIKKEDHEVTLKGTLTGFVPGEKALIGGAVFLMQADTKLEEAGKGTTEPERFQPGAWVKAESVLRDGGLQLRKLMLRERKEGEEEELQGTIVVIDHRRSVATVGDIEVRFESSVPVAWDVKDAEPPPMELRRLGPGPARQDGLMRVRHLDPEERRPEAQYRPFDWLTIGGEVKVESEWRNNHDLQDFQERDRLIHEASLLLEFSGVYSEHLYSFLRLRTGLGFVHFDEERDLSEGATLEVGELFILLEDLPFPGLSLQIGKQDIDDRQREWVTDDQLEAVRAWINLDLAVLELSVSEALFETAPEEDGITNYLAGLHVEPVLDQELFIYALHREHGTLFDLDRTHLGVSGEGGIGPFSWWLDLGWAFGKEDDLDVDGVGADVLISWTFDDWPLIPSLYAGLAYGSGDRDPFDGEDSRFRQTGLNDNQDRLNGTFAFRYLGELVRPDLQNLIVYTLGAEFYLTPRTSLDFLWHYYRQEIPLAALGPSRLRLTPTGESKDLGHELDVILGIYAFEPLRIQLVFAYFQPGAAFGPNPDDAWFATFEVKYVF